MVHVCVKMNDVCYESNAYMLIHLKTQINVCIKAKLRTTFDHNCVAMRDYHIRSVKEL